MSATGQKKRQRQSPTHTPKPSIHAADDTPPHGGQGNGFHRLRKRRTGNAGEHAPSKRAARARPSGESRSVWMRVPGGLEVAKRLECARLTAALRNGKVGRGGNEKRRRAGQPGSGRSCPLGSWNFP